MDLQGNIFFVINIAKLSQKKSNNKAAKYKWVSWIFPVFSKQFPNQEYN